MSALNKKNPLPPITQEAYPELWAALEKRGLLYCGDRPNGFIEGWEARGEKHSEPTIQQRLKIGDRVKITNSALTLWGEEGTIIAIGLSGTRAHVQLFSGPTIAVYMSCLEAVIEHHPV